MLTTKEKKEKNKTHNTGNCQTYLSCMMHYSRRNDGKERVFLGGSHICERILKCQTVATS